MSLDGHHAGLPYHVQLLSDPWRMSAWKRAIDQLIRPGDVVLDVGTGTGVLAVLAARAGAGRVIAVESSDAAELAKTIVADNHVQDVVEVIRADLATVPPEPVDVILCDFIGRLMPDAAMARALRAARGWAHEHTRWAPQSVRILAAPLAEIAHPPLDRLEIPLAGVDLTGALQQAYQVPWTVTAAAASLLADPTVIAALDPVDVPPRVGAQASWTLKNPGRFRGIVAWFEASLAPGLTLKTGPGRRTFWNQVLWPHGLTSTQPGDQVDVDVELHSAIDAVHMSWGISVRRGTQPLAPDTADDAAKWRAMTLKTLGPSLLSCGRPGPAASALLDDGMPTDAPGLAALITALASTGDPAAWQLLGEYEAAFGPHPTLRRGAP
ncbi:MAG: 50S ribosomal protein L11 methyltransferase [Myxococcota bacterium]